MSDVGQSQTFNVSTEQRTVGLLERTFFSTLIGLPCCVFLYVNGTMLFTLRSKSVFCETPRYVLLYNLLFGDTVLLALSQLLYILAVCKIFLTYPVCGVIYMFSILTSVISPLTLALMSLERYVAVCFPLRHAAIITIRNTAAAIAVVWAFSSLNVLIRVILLLQFPFSELESLQMTDFCSSAAMLLEPKSDVYHKFYTYFVFIYAAVAVVSSYVGVTVAARSASTDKASALKARKTLLLHLVQLGLSLLSTIHASVLLLLSTVLPRHVVFFLEMSDVGQSQTFNVSTEQRYVGLLERTFFSTLIGLPCCVLLFINGTMLFTLRSKSVFREMPRYVLLFNLLFADTVFLAMSQLLYIFSACRIFLTYPLCGVIYMFSVLTSVISPLTLVLMSLERYVAVCFPLRHAAIITIRNTAAAIAVVWAFSSLNVLIRVILLLEFPFSELQSLQMTDFCSGTTMFIEPKSDVYHKFYTYFVFISAAVTVSSSYVGVTLAARSASADKASALKARNTLLLHLVQLGLSLLSTMLGSLFLLLSTVLRRDAIVRVTSVFYVIIHIFSRCLSSLIYGLRDQNIRPILMLNLCWRLKRPS
ncbi:uncharacterized protein V6R79_012608 [Siganus canaliculatus]